MKTGRIFYLDVVRLLACSMVVLMHSPMPTCHENRLLVLGIGYLTAPCIGLFFMVSGALLLPVRNDAKDFLQKRLGKILAPTVVWTLFYISVKCMSECSFDIYIYIKYNASGLVHPFFCTRIGDNVVYVYSDWTLHSFTGN